MTRQEPPNFGRPEPDSRQNAGKGQSRAPVAYGTGLIGLLWPGFSRGRLVEVSPGCGHVLLEVPAIMRATGLKVVGNEVMEVSPLCLWV